jgi:hypothetical protein
LPKGTGRKERSGGVCVISSKRKEIKEAREKPLLAGRKRRLRGCVVGLEERQKGSGGGGGGGGRAEAGSDHRTAFI